ncbi:MAG: TetR family transcriptional regulator [Frankiales bacterium]|nr:TetR family transcriptional regulator [Frankiales bacterium]
MLGGEVLRAAMDLLRETGSEESVSLRAVAARVGVSVPSIYLHFADKQALLDAVCAEVFEQLHVAMKTASADAPNPWEALRAMGVSYVHFALDNPEHYRIVMMRGSSEQAPADEIASGAFGHLLDGVLACIGLGILEGDPVDLGLKLWAAAHGIASLLIAKPRFPWPQVDELVDATICMAGTGLAVGSRLPDELSPDEIVKRLEKLR